MLALPETTSSRTSGPTKEMSLHFSVPWKISTTCSLARDFRLWARWSWGRDLGPIRCSAHANSVAVSEICLNHCLASSRMQSQLCTMIAQRLNSSEES